jgi:hypothetical protein
MEHHQPPGCAERRSILQRRIHELDREPCGGQRIARAGKRLACPRIAPITPEERPYDVPWIANHEYETCPGEQRGKLVEQHGRGEALQYESLLTSQLQPRCEQPERSIAKGCAARFRRHAVMPLMIAPEVGADFMPLLHQRRNDRQVRPAGQ